MEESFLTYAERLFLTEEEKNFLEKVVEEIRGYEKVVLTGKGRSGCSALLGGYFLKEVGTNVYYSKDLAAPTKEEISENTLLIAVSGSGETEEVVRLAEVYKKLGAKVLAITYNASSSLAKLADYRILLPGKRGEAPKSYMERALVKPEDPTMGDLFEEKALVVLFYLAAVIGKREEEYGKFVEVVKETGKKREEIEKLTKLVENFWNSGIFFVGKGRSEIITKAVANRAVHYGIPAFTSGDITPPPVEHSNLVIIVSSSADKRYKKLVESLKAKVGFEIDGIKREPAFFGIFGVKPEWDDIPHIVLGGGERSDEIVLEKGELEPFYVIAPVFLNYVLRKAAERKGITKVFAEQRHTNI